MKLVVVSVVSPPRSVAGYLKRFLQEVRAGLFIGGVTTAFLEEIVSILELHNVDALVVVASQTRECGFSVVHAKMDGRAIVEFDGVPLVEVLSISS